MDTWIDSNISYHFLLNHDCLLQLNLGEPDSLEELTPYYRTLLGSSRDLNFSI